MNLQGKTVLVTGGTGFLGYWVCRDLRGRGANVVRAGRFQGDLTDRFQASALVFGTQPDAVIHLAAKCGGIGMNQARPGEFLRDNLLMGLNVLDACVAGRVEKVLVVGTACSYPSGTDGDDCLWEPRLWDGYPEPTNAPYGIAKRAVLEACAAYRKQYGLNAVCVIPANLYGPRDNFDLETGHVIPAIIRRVYEAMEAGERTIRLWGSGQPVRDFVYVQDAAEGIVTALERLEASDPVNLGSGHGVSIKAVATRIAELCGWDGQFVWDVSRPDGQTWRVLDTERAKQQLGWTATLPMDAGLRITIDWYNHERRSHAAAASAK